MEDTQKLNCFIIHQHIDKISLADIRREFPVPGNYHFRFQFVYQRNVVWLDLNNETCKVPRVDGIISIKALRLKWKETTVKPDKNDHRAKCQEKFLIEEELA